jgi:hypothetical protein
MSDPPRAGILSVHVGSLEREAAVVDDGVRTHRGGRWLYALLAVLALLGASFVAGMWFADRDERTVAGVVDSYAAVYDGLDTTKDVPVLLPLYAADATLRDVPSDRTHQGAAEIKDALEALLATPDFDLTIENTLVGDDWALVFWTADGRGPETRRVTQVAGITVLEVSGGTIERETWYYDPAKAPF